MTKLIEERLVPVPNEMSDKIGWGQYLDEDHKSRRQWGRYGTSAAVRALACAQRATDDSPVTRRPVFRRVHPLLLPDEAPADPDPELKTGDFDRVVKLSYTLEGVRPQESRVAEGAEPPLVKHLIGLRHPGQKGWSSRDGHDSFRDRRLSTAVALHAFRRFPGDQEHVREAYVWLAREMLRDNVQIDLAALVGIALVEARESIRNLPEVKDGLAALDEKLTRWAAGQKRLTIDRPYFNGFVEHDRDTAKDSTDYVFLSPELLAARYFLKRDLPQMRRFVLRVVSALVENIRHNTANGMGGYAIQGTMIRTVDQAWALDLLETFESIRKDAPRKLLPRRTGWLTKFGVLVGLWVTVFIAMVVVLIIAALSLVSVFPVVLGVLLTLALRSRR